MGALLANVILKHVKTSMLLFFMIIFLVPSCDDIEAIPEEDSGLTQYEELMQKYDTEGEVEDEIVSTDSALSLEDSADYWIKRYGGFYFNYTTIQETGDNGYIVGATIVTQEKSGDLFAMKLNNAGDIEWNSGYGLEGFDRTTLIHEILGDGYVLTGRLYVSGNSEDYWVSKIDADGTIQWQKAYGGNEADYINASIQTSDGGFILAGRTHSHDGDTNSNMMLIKIDETGNVLWEKNYESGLNVNEIYSIRECPDGSLIAVVSGDHLVKFGSQGNVLWCKYFDCSMNVLLKTVDVTSDNGFIISAYIRPYQNREFLIIKADSQGDVLWSTVFGDPEPNAGTVYNTVESVCETSDGGYIILANTDIDKYYCYFPIIVYNDDPAGYRLRNQLVRVIKLDSTGTIAWEKSYRNKLRHKWLWPILLKYNFIEGHSILETDNGDYVISGSFAYSDYSDNSIFIMKMDGNGELAEADFITKDTEIETQDGGVSVQNSGITAHESSIFTVTDTNVTVESYDLEVDEI